MSERGKSNSISRSRTHTNRSTAEKQTSKNKNRSEFDQSISDTESRERNEEKCYRRYLISVWEKKERQRDGECVAAAESTSTNHESHKTQTLYESKETQHDSIKRERSTWTYLTLYLLPTHLPTFLPSYLLIFLFTYLPAFSLPRKWNNFLVCNVVSDVSISDFIYPPVRPRYPDVVPINTLVKFNYHKVIR